MDRQCLTCLGCGAERLASDVNQSDPVRCPVCGRPGMNLVFPAQFQKPVAGTAGEHLVSEDESSCFYHPKKKAAVVCDHCGRFLCALCDVDLHGRHFCPGCLENSAGKEKVPSLETGRRYYDRIALALAIVPMFLFCPMIPFCSAPSLLTAPAAIYVSIRYWNHPGSLLGWTRFRFVLATLLAVAQIIGWITYLALIILSLSRR